MLALKEHACSSQHDAVCCPWVLEEGGAACVLALIEHACSSQHDSVCCPDGETDRLGGGLRSHLGVRATA